MDDEARWQAHVAAQRARGAVTAHLGDLYLAWTAGLGDPAALRQLEPWLAAEADAAARSIDPAAGFADEVRQALRVRLLVRDGDRIRLHDYGGRGPLRAWIGVAALRVALNLRRGAGPATRDLLDERVDAEADPELRYLKALYRSEFRAALTAALAALPDRERALLRLCYVDGLSLAQLGRLYQVHETTAGRWVHAAAGRVADDARARLTTRLALSRSSLDSVARMVMSGLDVSIARVLA